jgi:hypothetical protein
MKRGVLLAAVLSVFLTVTETATAKGPTAASITGPGLSDPLVLDGLGESGDGSPMAVLTMEGGFFPATFGEYPDRMLPGRPAGDLGPRYKVVYTVPGPTDEARIRQSLFPYAEGGPVLYTPPDQPFFETERTRGGWFRASERLRAALVRAGLPEASPAAVSSAQVSSTSPQPAVSMSSSGGSGPSGLQLGIAAVAAALTAALGGTVLARRRRSRSRPRPVAGPSGR